MLHKLSHKELKEIVNIHMQTLSNDVLPQLGSAYLLTFYKYLNRSEKEIFFLEKENNKIIGCCIISLEPETLFNRVVKFTFLNFMKSLFINVFTKQQLRKYIFDIIIQKDKSISKSPEIIYIYIDKNFQNKGIGGKLINKIKKYLLSEKYNNLYVKTIDKQNNHATKFYKQNHFLVYTNFQYAGNQYLYLQKDLNV